MRCCDRFGDNCNQGRACPLRTRGGGARIDTSAKPTRWPAIVASLAAFAAFCILAAACFGVQLPH